MLTLVTVSLGYVQGSAYINLLLCVALVVSPLVLFIKSNRIFLPWIDIPFLLVCGWIIIVPAIAYPETVRPTTILFTCSYCVYFMMFARVVKNSNLNADRFLQFSRIIIYAFFAMLVIQQICVLLRLPVINQGVKYLMRWKLNSLTAEPSHTALTLCFVMFIYNLSIRAIHPNYNLWNSVKRNWAVWACWAWTIFTTYNATSFVLAPMVILPFITLRNVWKYAIFAAIVMGVICLLPRNLNWNIDRIRDYGAATVTLDDRSMIEADGSMASRFVPTIWGFRSLRADRDLIIGHGVDADMRDIEDKPYDGRDDEGSAGVFKMTYNYGLPCALLLWIGIGIVTLSRRNWWTVISFLYAVYFSADFNMQHLWLIICYALVYKTIVCKDDSILSTLNSGKQIRAGA